MKRAFYANALAMAERHVALGERHIADQHRIIAKLDARGSDLTRANSLLATFMDTQKTHERDRLRFLHEISQLHGR